MFRFQVITELGSDGTNRKNDPQRNQKIIGLYGLTAVMASKGTRDIFRTAKSYQIEIRLFGSSNLVVQRF